MKKVKKITAVLISVILTVSVFFTVPLTASAEVYGDYDYEVYYSTDENGNEYQFATITAYRGSSSSLTIPSSVDGYSVEAIESCAFYDSTFETVTIPASVTYIAIDAFMNCDSLKSFTVNSANKYYCSQNGVLYNKDITEIISYPSASTSTSYSIPDGILSIECAFVNCSNLKTISIPKSVMNISASNIYNCPNLSAINVDSANEYYCSIDGVLFSVDKTQLILYPQGKTATSYSIPSTVTNICDNAFNNCTNIITVNISDSVVNIYESAFYGCLNLQYIYIPETVSYIGSSAFQDTAWLEIQDNGAVYAGNILYTFKGNPTSATTVTVKNGTTGISDYAFAYRNNITAVTIPQSVKYIGLEAFSNCSNLAKVNFNAKDCDMSSDAFSGCDALTTVVFGSTVKYIPKGAFAGCTALATVTVAEEVTNVGNGALLDTPWYNNQSDGVVYLGKIAYCYKGNMPSNSNITLNSGTKSLASSLFEGYDNLLRVTIPSGVTYIGKNAFAYCESLTGVNLPSTVTTIDDGAFVGCSTITGITIPSSVTYIGNDVFFNCKSLTGIDVSTENTSYCGVDGVLLNAYKTEILVYPMGKRSTTYSVPDGVLSLGDIFAYNNVIQEITIPDSVIDIGSFTNCTALKTINIGSGAENIDVSAFDGCNSLQSINVSSSNINNSSVDGVLFNKEKTELMLYPIKKMDSEYLVPSTVNKISDYAFLNCGNLFSVDILSNVEYIGYAAFENCENLNSIMVYSKKAEIDDYAFGYLLYFEDNGEYSLTTNENLTISGYADTNIEAYANENGITFNTITDIVGDFDESGVINIKDVTSLQRYIASNAPITGKILNSSDVNHDGKVNILDATVIQRYCANLISEF